MPNDRVPCPLPYGAGTRSWPVPEHLTASPSEGRGQQPPPPAIPAGPLFDRPGVLPPEMPDDLTAPTEETTAP